MKQPQVNLRNLFSFSLTFGLLALFVACGKTGQDGGAGYTSTEEYTVDLMDMPPPPPLEPAKAAPEEGQPPMNTEDYNKIVENPFQSPINAPLSTFSIDVDAAAYANVRRFLNNSEMPPADAVRTEELVNYFNYDYPQPTDRAPFSVITEQGSCPWNTNHQLVHIGLQGLEVPKENLPPSNLVFLLDVSGSMDEPNKLPLLKNAFRLLTDELRPQDHVSIVVYAGAAGLVLEPTPGDEKKKILDALENLEAGGSTAGGEGIELAYATAKAHYKAEGNNRVILASDGDFNVGPSSDGALERLIEKKREEGIFLTTLGFGMGNYKDNKMETLADKGNGNYAYIDNILEARKVLVNEFGGTLFTIAKDVKLQLEFNPAKVKGYRLIGYENRMLAAEDFNDDKKDAGDLGSGHTVTALYELIPAGSDEKVGNVDELKYQQTSTTGAASTDELFTVKLRYKEPKDSTSQLITLPVKDKNLPVAQTSENFRWSAAVAAFSLLLRDSEYKADADFALVRQLAEGAQGEDPHGFRGEFLHLVKVAEALSGVATTEE